MKSRVQNGPERLRYYSNISAVGPLYQAPVHSCDLSINANHEGSHHLSHSHDLRPHMDTVHVILIFHQDLSMFCRMLMLKELRMCRFTIPGLL